MDTKFCPQCGSLLELLENSALCLCCKFQRQQANSEVVLEKKFTHQKIDETTVTEQRPIIEESCTKCGHNKAYFSTMQMRSADEGQTVFYECCKCGFRTKVNT